MQLLTKSAQKALIFGFIAGASSLTITDALEVRKRLQEQPTTTVHLGVLESEKQLGSNTVRALQSWLCGIGSTVTVTFITPPVGEAADDASMVCFSVREALSSLPVLSGQPCRGGHAPSSGGSGREAGGAPLVAPRTGMPLSRPLNQRPDARQSCRNSTLDRLLYRSASGMLRPWMPTYASLHRHLLAAGAHPEDVRRLVRMLVMPRARTILNFPAGRVKFVAPESGVPGAVRMAPMSGCGTLRLLQQLQDRNQLALAWCAADADPAQSLGDDATGAGGSTGAVPSQNVDPFNMFDPGQLSAGTDLTRPVQHNGTEYWMTGAGAAFAVVCHLGKGAKVEVVEHPTPGSPVIVIFTPGEGGTLFERQEGRIVGRQQQQQSSGAGSAEAQVVGGGEQPGSVGSHPPKVAFWIRPPSFSEVHGAAAPSATASEAALALARRAVPPPLPEAAEEVGNVVDSLQVPCVMRPPLGPAPVRWAVEAVASCLALTSVCLGLLLRLVTGGSVGGNRATTAHGQVGARPAIALGPPASDNAPAVVAAPATACSSTGSEQHSAASAPAPAPVVSASRTESVNAMLLRKLWEATLLYPPGVNLERIKEAVLSGAFKMPSQNVGPIFQAVFNAGMVDVAGQVGPILRGRGPQQDGEGDQPQPTGSAATATPATESGNGRTLFHLARMIEAEMQKKKAERGAGGGGAVDAKAGASESGVGPIARPPAGERAGATASHSPDPAPSPEIGTTTGRTGAQQGAPVEDGAAPSAPAMESGDAQQLTRYLDDVILAPLMHLAEKDPACVGEGSPTDIPAKEGEAAAVAGDAGDAPIPDGLAEEAPAVCTSAAKEESGAVGVGQTSPPPPAASE